MGPQRPSRPKRGGMFAHTRARSPPRMSDIRTVDPVSHSQLIVSQSQLLPFFWPVIGAKRPIILALPCARAPTQRPERLQENVMERPFMHLQSQRSISRVYLYRLRSIHLNSSVSHHIHCERNLLCIVNIDPLPYHPLGREGATNTLVTLLGLVSYRDKALTEVEVPCSQPFEQYVSCEV